MKLILSLNLASFALLAAIPGFSQSKGAVKGRIIGQSTKRPITGASVFIYSKGQITTSQGVATDSTGRFVLADLPEGSYTLLISSVGYQEKTLRDILVVPSKTFFVETELAASADSLQEAVVKTFKSEYTPLAPVSTYTFSREEIFRIPGSQGDIFRAIGILPGVSSSGGQFSAISVRGQGTSDNVYMVDDIPMFQVSHLEGNGAFSDPNGGRFSIFAPRTIDNAQFQGGGFAAQYGRKSSSYLGLEVKEGNTESSSLTGQFDLLGFTLLYDGPSGFDKRTGIFATARYQNFSLLEKVVGLKGIGLPEYGDYMIKTTTQLNARNKLTAIAMYNPESYVNTPEDVGQVEPIQGTDIVNTSNYKSLIGLNLRTLTGSRNYWRNILYYRSLNGRADLGTTTPQINAAGDIVNKGSIPSEADLQKVKNDQTELGYRSVFTGNFGKSSLTAGIDLARVALDYSRYLKHTDTLYTFGPDDYRPDPTKYYLILEPSQFNSADRSSAINASAYADLSFVVFKALHLNMGIRWDQTGFTQLATVSPRLSGSLPIGGHGTLNFATGIFYQDPEYGDVGDQPAGHRLRQQKTVQYIFGYKKYFSQDLKFIAEGWYKEFSDQVIRPQSDQPFLTNAGTGYAYGLDLSITKRLSEKYYGQASYSYMLSKRDDHDGLGLYNYAFSQPHVFSLLASYKPNDKWVFSTKFRYATGRPKDNFIIHADVFQSSAFLRYSQEIVGHNASRLGDYISLDIRSDYHVQFRKLSLTAFVDIVDVLDRNNQSGEFFQPLNGSTYYQGLAIFPTFGVILGI